MQYDKSFVTAKLRKWKRVFGTVTLPSWDELPTIDLYMDQVITLLLQYLSFFPTELGGEKFVTQSAINNYVRLKVIPAPVKKRYTRIHLAYLIIICCLKATLNISYIQKMLPVTLNEEEVAKIYTDFVAQFRVTSRAFITQVEDAAVQVLDPEDDSETSVNALVSATALNASLHKLLTEKLLNIQNEDDLSKI